jgi:hypothetical protein
MSEPDFSHLVPIDLKPSVSDALNLKPSIVTPSYSGGTPKSASEVKPSIVYDSGFLKLGMVNNSKIKPSLLLGDIPPRDGIVYDLRPEPVNGEILDTTLNNNNAILSTGWAVTLDGITGHLHVTFATQQNVTVLTARVRSSTDTTFYAGTENASGTDTIVANNTWQDVSVTISDSVADELFVGSDDGVTNFFAGDICDVRVASVGTWYLNDHPAGSLDGLPAFDSSGNGNDGVHVGGTSIVGVGAPVPQTALQDWNLNGSGYYVPEDQSNLGFDVEGNAIANPRGELLNPRGVAGDYAEILDDPSLDVTTEWSGALVGNLYNPNVGTDQMLIGRYDATNNKRSWLLYFNDTSPSRLTVALSSNGTSVSATLLYSLSDEEAVYSWSYNGGTNSFTFYKNGAALNPTSTGGTIPSSLFTTDIPIRLFQDFNGANPSDKQFGKMLMYNKALSDSDHAQLYRALRRYL